MIDRLQNLVYEALVRMRDTGNLPDDESAETTAINVLDYDVEIFEEMLKDGEEITVMDVIPHVERWREFMSERKKQ